MTKKTNSNHKSQVLNTRNDCFTKRGSGGQFVKVKSDNKPFKNIPIERGKKSLNNPTCSVENLVEY